MKTNPFPHENPRSEPQVLRASALALALALAAAAAPALGADGDAQTPAQTASAATAEKPAPLPLHQIEGNGGIFSTLSAYIVNPPRNGEPVGRPSLGFAFVNIGHGQNLEATTLTESPCQRLELGYGWDYMNLGDLPAALRSAGLVNFHQGQVQMHNFNARFQILSEGEFDQKWLPALTAGVHYKYTDNISEVNHEVRWRHGRRRHYAP